MSHDYFAQSMRALQLGGKSERTQEAYTRAVRMLVEFYGKPPEQIAEVELEEYFLHRRNMDKWSAATLRIAYSGVRFFFIHVLGRNWHRFTYLNAKRPQGLPCILDRDEVLRVLGCVITFTTTPAWLPSTPVACASPKPWPCKSPILTASAR